MEIVPLSLKWWAREGNVTCLIKNRKMEIPCMLD